MNKPKDFNQETIQETRKFCRKIVKEGKEYYYKSINNDYETEFFKEHYTAMNPEIAKQEYPHWFNENGDLLLESGIKTIRDLKKDGSISVEEAAAHLAYIKIDKEDKKNTYTKEEIEEIENFRRSKGVIELTTLTEEERIQYQKDIEQILSEINLY